MAGCISDFSALVILSHVRGLILPKDVSCEINVFDNRVVKVGLRNSGEKEIPLMQGTYKGGNIWIITSQRSLIPVIFSRSRLGFAFRN